MKLKKDNLRSVAVGIVMILTAACSESVPESTSVAVKAEPSAAAAVSAEDAQMARGKLVFASCALCHSTGVGGPDTIGPNLAGVLGSEAGISDDFIYSEPLLASGIVWTEDALDKFIESPAAFIPGGTMAFVGIPNAKDRQSLITYLIAKTSGADGSDPALFSDQGDDVAAWE
jgi:cytochrome c